MADERIVSGAFGVGTAFHALLLEPDSFSEAYELLPEASGTGRTNAERLEQAAFLNAPGNAGKLFLKSADMKMLHAMAAGAMEHPEVWEILGRGGKAEVGFYGSRDGERVKVRVDLIEGLDWEPGDGPDPGLVIVDLKTTQDASPAAFRESVIRYNYAAQQAWYTQGVESVTGRKVKDFIFMVSEKNWPYHAGVYRLGPMLAEDGEAVIEEAWGRYKECKARDQWPHYGDGGVMEL